MARKNLNWGSFLRLLSMRGEYCLLFGEILGEFDQRNSNADPPVVELRVYFGDQSLETKSWEANFGLPKSKWSGQT